MVPKPLKYIVLTVLVLKCMKYIYKKNQYGIEIIEFYKKSVNG